MTSDRARLAAFLVLGFALMPLFASILDATRHWPDLPAKDWVAMREVGVRLAAGEVDRLYEDQSVDAGWVLLFLYPPFVAWAFLPLAALPAPWAWVVMALAQAGFAVAALLVLRRVLGPMPHLDLVVLATVASAPFTHVVVTGQNSGLLMLLAALGALLLGRRHPWAAGAVLGLLACKPNWTPGFLLLAAWQGGPRAVLGFAASVGALLLTSLPLGTGVWADYGEMMQRSQGIVTGIPGFKKIALRATFESAGLAGTPLDLAWLVCAIGLGSCLLVVLGSSRDAARWLGATVLFTVAANPYMNFYDALVLAIPAAIWWSTRATWSPWLWWAAGACVAFVFVWDHVVFYGPLVFGQALDVLPFWPPGSVLGVPVALWLVLDTLDCWRHRATTTTEGSWT